MWEVDTTISHSIYINTSSKHDGLIVDASSDNVVMDMPQESVNEDKESAVRRALSIHE